MVCQLSGSFLLRSSWFGHSLFLRRFLSWFFLWLFCFLWFHLCRFSFNFDNLDCAFWALWLACSAENAFLNSYWHRFAAFDLVDTGWAIVDAGFTSSTFRVDYDFYHFFSSCRFLIALVLNIFRGHSVLLVHYPRLPLTFANKYPQRLRQPVFFVSRNLYKKQFMPFPTEKRARRRIWELNGLRIIITAV